MTSTISFILLVQKGWTGFSCSYWAQGLAEWSWFTVKRKHKSGQLPTYMRPAVCQPHDHSCFSLSSHTSVLWKTHTFRQDKHKGLAFKAENTETDTLLPSNAMRCCRVKINDLLNNCQEKVHEGANQIVQQMFYNSLFIKFMTWRKAPAGTIGAQRFVEEPL